MLSLCDSGFGVALTMANVQIHHLLQSNLTVVYYYFVTVSYSFLTVSNTIYTPAVFLDPEC